MVFDNNIRFHGNYREYQKRVLDNLEHFLTNEKIHVVAAPGSGKTILGLELIKRLDNVSLILVPSIAIREQWILRFKDNFLDNDEDYTKWISNDIRIFRPIMCITYQAFYAANKKLNIENTEDDDEDVDINQNYEDFNFQEIVNKYNIKTLCLDECHHLKLEWQKVIENFVNKTENLKIIALTATPPYDSSNQEWKRYTDLCGPIDDEIFVPELIKDNNLCPHQDYVFFSYPTDDEKINILKHYSNGIKLFSKLYNDNQFIDLVRSNNIYKDYKKFKIAYYNNEPYYRAMISFLYEHKIHIPLFVKLLVHVEKFDYNMLDVLLQNILFDDQASYIDNKYKSGIKKTLSSYGMVKNRKVNIIASEKINKIITGSLSKLESIKQIVDHESKNNKKIKCVILTDFIKEKEKSNIGNDNPIKNFGTVPIFEYLRRANIDNIVMCCITGSICIVPKIVTNYLTDGYTFNQIGNLDYYEINVPVALRKKLVIELTNLFEKGIFNLIIGTKSLLGEGWDSPCIDTLILASFIGSYVLSNQTRGRAIRKYNDKVSNIWHLATLDPFDYHYSQDYINLKKRFDSFVGIDFKNKKIENGIERLGIYDIPDNAKTVNNFNVKSLQESTKRNEVKDIWNDCINNAKNIEYLTKKTIITRKRFRKDYTFFSHLISALICVFTLLFISRIYNHIEHNLFTTILINASAAIFSLLFLLFSFRILILGNPETKLYWISKRLLKSLIKTKIINSKKIKIIIKRENYKESVVYLENAMIYEQNIFSTSLTTLIGPVDKPRYLIAIPRNLHREYYVIPDAFKKTRGMAKILYNELRFVLGPSKLIFAKSDNKTDALFAEKLYSIKYKNVEIKSKYILLQTKRKKIK